MTRTKWTSELIAERILKVAGSGGVMPTNTFLTQSNQCDLANAISKNGGYIAWAEQLCLSRNQSDSDTGWLGEIAVKVLLESRGFAVERSTAVKWPHDLLVNGCLRVDVKSARFAEYGACKGWFYRIGKSPQADVIALYQLDTSEIYWLPWYLCPQTNVTISKNGGKYSRFRESYQIVTDMAAARSSEAVKFREENTITASE